MARTRFNSDRCWSLGIEPKVSFHWDQALRKWGGPTPETRRPLLFSEGHDQEALFKEAAYLPPSNYPLAPHRNECARTADLQSGQRSERSCPARETLCLWLAGRSPPAALVEYFGREKSVRDAF